MRSLVQLDAAFGAERARPLSLALMLAIAYGCSIGGVATPVGTPTNLALLKIYRDSFPGAPAIGFAQWMFFATPLAAVLLLIAWFLLARVFCRSDHEVRLDRAVVERELRALGPLTGQEWRVLVVFVVTALAWVFRQDINLGSVTIPGWSSLSPALVRVDDGTVAIALAVLLFLLPAGGGKGALLDAGAFARVPWDILLLFGGGFALAAGFTSTGLSQYLAGAFGALGHVPPWAALLAVCVLLTFLTELTSNVATATMFLPVLAAWSVAEGMHPLMLMMPATISASMAFMLPVATPPNAVVFSSRRVRIADMARIGLALNLVGVVVVFVFSRWLLPWIFDFDATQLPVWAPPPPPK